MKTFMKITAVIASVLSFIGCSAVKPQVLDGDNSVYKDSEYRTEFANVLDFDSCEGTPLFAVAFLGYGEDRWETGKEYIENTFSSLDEELTTQVGLFRFEGDEWYLVVPRYREYVDITNVDTGEKQTMYQGMPFLVRCNVSDLYSNIEISTDINGGHSFSPQMGGDGKLVTSEDIYDITDYNR